jgi:hypothetical protein
VVVDRAGQLVASSLALAMIVGLIGAPVLAQPADEIGPAAGLDADTVDGKHAVAATNKVGKRANKLVATNRAGQLPSNILRPLWSLVQGIPAILADGQVSWAELVAIPAILADGQVGWGEVAGIPAGFADAADNVGYASATLPATYNLPPKAAGPVGVYADVPLGVDVELYVIPAVGASLIAYGDFMERGPRATSGFPGLPAVPADMVRSARFVANSDATATTFKVRIRVFDTGISPAALKKVAKHVKVGVVKVPKRAASEMQRRVGR